MTKEAKSTAFLLSFVWADMVYMMKNRSQMMRYGTKGRRFIELVTLLEDKKLSIRVDR